MSILSASASTPRMLLAAVEVPGRREGLGEGRLARPDVLGGLGEVHAGEAGGVRDGLLTRAGGDNQYFHQIVAMRLSRSGNE